MGGTAVRETEAPDQPARRSGRTVYALWAGGLLLLAAIGLVCWWLRPILEVRSAFRQAEDELTSHGMVQSYPLTVTPEAADQITARLGGSRRAVWAIARSADAWACLRTEWFDDLAVAVMIRADEAGFAELLRLVHQPGGLGVPLMAQALGKRGDPRAIGPLVRLVAQPGAWGSRSAAAEALGLLGDAGAAPALVPMLRSEACDDREAAARALGRLRHAPATDDLIAIVEQDQRPEPRRAAAEALGALGATRAAGALTVLVGDFEVGPAAEEALVRIGRPAVQALKAALAGASPNSVRKDRLAGVLFKIKSTP